MQKHFIFLGLILFSYTIQGQNALFNKTLDLNPFVREQTKAGSNTLDGGHIIIGTYSDPFVETDSSILAKYDANGCLEWTKVINPHETALDIWEPAIQQYADGTYLAAMTYQNPNHSNNNIDLALVKFDTNGEILWVNNYGWPNSSDAIFDLLILPNQEAVFVGRFIEDGQGKGYVIKIDQEGNKLWEYKRIDRTLFTEIRQNNIGNFIISSSTPPHIYPDYTTPNDSAAKVIEITAEGEWLKETYILEKTWDKITNGTSGLTIASNGDYIVCGQTSFLNNKYGAFIARLDSSHNVLWRNEEPNNFFVAEASDIIELSDGSLLMVLTVQTEINQSPEDEIIYSSMLRKFTPDGEMIWEKTLLAPNEPGFFQYDNVLLNMVLMENDHVLLTGYTSELYPESPSFNSKLWMVKVDSAGNYIAPLEASLTPNDTYLFEGNNTQINFEVNSHTGCYTYEFSGNALEYLQEDSLGSLQFVNAPIGEHELFCTITDEIDQTIEVSTSITVDEDTSLETIKDYQVKTYPNPATTSLTFSYQIEKQETLLLYNALGQLVQEITLAPSSNNQTISTESFTGGIYYWQLGNQNGKLIISR